MVIGIDFSRGNIPQKTGTENYSYCLTKELIKIGAQDKIRLYTKNNLSAQLKQFQNVENRVIPLKRLWTQIGLAAECLVNPPDVLFIPAHTLPVMRRPSLKTVVTIHDLGAEYLPDYHKFPQKLYLNKSTVYAVKHATKLIAVSEATKEDLITRLQCDIKKITVIPESYDNETYKVINDAQKVKAIKIKYNLPDQIMMFVGTIQPRKNIARIIKSFSMAAKESNIPHHLVLAGKSGWLNDDIYKLPEKLGIVDRVHFLGYVPSEEVALLLNGSDLFLFPSLFEGFGIPLLEAMACGCPVITSNLSCMPEVANNVGVLVDPLDEVEIAKAIKQVLSDEKLRKEMKEKGLGRVKEYSWNKSARETYELLKEVARNG